jgi:DNA polymerase-3 subunit delta'
MVWPEPADSLAWLGAQGLDSTKAAVALKAQGGRPQAALHWAQSGQDPAHWAALPQAMARGDGQAVRDWTPQQVISAQQQLCHDLLALAVDAKPRFFSAKDLRPGVPLAVLSQWGVSLQAHRRTMDHPYNPGLFIEALMAEAHTVLAHSAP